MKLNILTSLLVGATLAVSGTASATTMWKLSHNQDRTHPVHKAMQFFADKANEYTEGEVRIRLYPNATLGNERESIELMKSNALQMVKVSAASLESFDSSFGMFSLPYIFSDRDAYYKVLSGPIGEKILQSPSDKGFAGVAYYEAGARSFYTSKPIKTPADLTGMKIRVMSSPTAVNMVKALGGVPTPMPQGELYTALQQGVVDGGENNPVVYADMRHFEVSDEFSLDEHAMIPDVLIVSNQAMDALSEADRKAVKRAAMESMMYMKETLWPAAEKAAFDKVKAGNATVHAVDKGPFKERVTPLYDDFKASHPALASDLDIILSY